MIAALLYVALAAPDPCAGVLDRIDACPSPASLQAPTVSDAKTDTTTLPWEDQAVAFAPVFAVGGTIFVAAGAGLVGVSYGYAAALVDALHAGNLDAADRDALVVGQRATLGTAIASFTAAALLYGTSAAFVAFDPTSGKFLLPLFTDDKE